MPDNKKIIEESISEAFVKFQRVLIGRGPLEIRTYIIEDMILIRTRGVLTVEETHLAQSDRGRQIVKEMRQVLRENSSAEAQQLVSRLCGSNVVSSHSDISTKTGERVEIYVLDENLEKKLKMTGIKNDELAGRVI